MDYERIERQQQYITSLIAQDPGPSTQLAWAYAGLAGAYGNVRNFSEAVRNHEMAASIFLQCNDHEDAARSYGSIAGYYERLIGNMDKAEEAYRKAAEVAPPEKAATFQKFLEEFLERQGRWAQVYS